MSIFQQTNIIRTTALTDLDLQCSYASVTLVDKLPSSYQERAPTAPAPKYRKLATSAGCSPPPTSGARKTTNGGGGGAAEGSSEGGHESPAEDKRGGADVKSRLTLALFGGVRVDKVVEKGALGTTARAAMAVSCAEVRARHISSTRYPACFWESPAAALSVA